MAEDLQFLLRKYLQLVKQERALIEQARWEEIEPLLNEKDRLQAEITHSRTGGEEINRDVVDQIAALQQENIRLTKTARDGLSVKIKELQLHKKAQRAYDSKGEVPFGVFFDTRNK